MKIAYFFSCFPQVSTTFLQREIRELEKQGIKPVLIANRSPESGGYHPFDKDLADRTFYLNPMQPVRYIKSNINMFKKSPRQYIRGLKLAFRLKDKNYPGLWFRNLARVAGAAVLADYLEKNKVAHVHVHFAFGAAGVAVFLKTISQIPYSISIHGSDVLLPQPLTEEKLKHAQFIISNCRFHIHNLRHRYPSLYKNRFYLIYLGIDIHSPPWSKTEPLTSDSNLRILNVARLDPVKGHEILVQACNYLQKKGVAFHCKIIGDGPSRHKIKSLISRLNLENSVNLPGICYEAEVAELFDWAHVMVLSSLSEGTPMTIIEAMTKMRPVIAPRITAIPEMIIEGINGFLFTKGRYDELAEKLSIFADNLELAEKMGKEGRKQAEEQYDLQQNVKKLISVFAKEIPVSGLNIIEEIDYV